MENSLNHILTAKSLLENLPRGYLLYDFEKNLIVYANRWARKILDFTGEETKAILKSEKEHTYLEIDSKQQKVFSYDLPAPLRQFLLLELEFIDEDDLIPDKKTFKKNCRRLFSENHGDINAVIMISFESTDFSKNSFASDKKIIYEIYSRLVTLLGENTLFGRWKQKTIAFILPASKTMDFISRIQCKLSEPYKINSSKLHININQGIVPTKRKKQTVSKVFKAAEKALERADNTPGPAIEFSRRTAEIVSTKNIRLLPEFFTAMREKQFELYFQPQVDGKDLQLCGLEALLRWNHPREGLLLPGQFLPQLESSGLIFFLGEWIIEEGLRLCQVIDEKSNTEIICGFNLSARQFSDPELTRNLNKETKKYQFDKCKLELEITETTILQDIDTTIDILSQLRNLPARIALDDFGTGYSSLYYLHKLPITGIKVDRCFLHEKTTEANIGILEAIVKLGKQLDLEIVIEGIENKFHAQIAKNLNVDRLQGYLHGRPQPVNHILKLIEKQNAAT